MKGGRRKEREEVEVEVEIETEEVAREKGQEITGQGEQE